MKGIFLGLLAILLSQQCFTQSNYAISALTSPSDNSSFLAAYGLGVTNDIADVDLYTGTARVNIPLCNLESNELKFPVSLSYISGRGVKVQDVASQVGLGWQLNAGGAISRVVRGLPDENVNGYLGTNGDGHNVKAYVTGQTAYNSNPILDQEPDMFYVRTPFLSFHFSFDDYGNAVIPNDNGYKIITNLYNYSGSPNTYFEVIDDQGNQYYFGSSPASQDGVTTSSTLTNRNGTTTTTSYTFPITWYLDKIVTFNSKDVITLNYFSGANYSVSNFLGYTTCFYSFSPGHYTEFDEGSTVPITNYTAPKYISSIVSPLGEIDFAYAYDRSDFAGVGRLTNVSLKAYNPLTGTNSNTLKTFNLNYSYFGTPSTDPNQLRLRLDNITVTGSTPSTAGPLTLNSFDYNLTTNLPPRNSPQFDYWGYYNANSAITADTWNLFPDASNRAPNATSASANVLIGIHNLTGELTQIQYELNTYYNGGNISVGGLRANLLTRTYPNSATSINTQYVYNDANGNSTGMIYGANGNNNIYAILSALDANYDASWNASLSIPGVVFPAWAVQTFNVSPYNTYDVSGNFVGYSAVKTVNQNGGYTISQFSNFSDFPDVYAISAISYATGNFWGQYGAYSGEGAAPTLQEQIPGSISSYDYSYKRGVLRDKTIYNANGNKIMETINTYSILNPTSPLTSYGYRQITWNATNTYEYYSTHIENYRLTQTIAKNYDQNNTSNYVQKTNKYSYCPNYRSISTDSTTESKGLIVTQNFYHADDTNIPMVTASEQTAITAMVAANRKNVDIHEIDNRNSVIHQLHYSYNAYPVTTSTNHIYLASGSAYIGNTQVKQQLYQYDPVSSNLISSNMSGGKAVSLLYAFNSSIVNAEAVNATRSIATSVQPLTQSGTITMPANYLQTQNSSFSTAFAGTITVAMPPGGYLAQSGGATCFFSVYLSGAGTGSGNLCNSSVTGYSCSVSNTVSFLNMPAGAYLLSVTALTNTSSSTIPVNFTYSGSQVVTVATSESFFEGFEQIGNVTTNAHTGNASYSGTYSVNYSVPNSRSYVMQWWSYANSVWNFNEQAYTGPTTLSGQIDDVRIFPTDAQITTYSFNPQVGMTGRTDSAGRTTTYQYDALSRLSLIRDNDQNILKEFDYEYQALIDPVYNSPQSGTFTKNNCATGGTGGSVTYTVPANTYSSVISLADANQKAVNDVNANGQNYANANGICTFYNVVTSGTFTRNNCATGGTGSSVVYTVAANTYSSTVSQAAANTLAQNDVNANGQSYANTNGVCTFYNVAESGTYTKSNCSCGYSGNPTTYTVAANTYSSTVSQTAANTLAQNDVNANGQNYANANGTCTQTLPCSGNNHKIINCACQTGTLDIISQTNSGGKCITKYGYYFSDGSYNYDHTTTQTGSCAF